MIVIAIIFKIIWIKIILKKISTVKILKKIKGLKIKKKEADQRVVQEVEKKREIIISIRDLKIKNIENIYLIFIVLS